MDVVERAAGAARLVAVSRAHHVKPDPGNDSGLTGIDKRPVDGPVLLDAAGVAGDRVMDVKDHGGRDKAVYVYAAEDAADWARILGQPVPPGRFGENLTTSGLNVTGAVVGERWSVGAAVLEVTMPRTPCATFQRHLGQPRWVRRFTEYGAPGAYCRVLRAGAVQAGDTVAVVHRPDHAVTIGEVFGPAPADPGRLDRLLAEQSDLAPDLVRALRRRGAPARPAGPTDGPV